MGLGAWFKDKKETVQLWLAWRRASSQWERDMDKQFDPLISIRKGLTSVFNHAFYAALFAFLVALADEKTMTRFLEAANVNTAYIGVIVLALRFVVRAASNALKNNPDFQPPTSAGPDLKAGALAGALVLALMASPAIAQEPAPTSTPAPDAMSWLSAHSAIVSGTYSTDASSRQEFVGIRIFVEGALAPKLRGWAQLDLFTRSRDGQSTTPALPSSPAGLAVYSSGEFRLGAYRPITGLLSVECLAGATFPMPSLGAAGVDPLDGVKILAGCGPRVGTPATFVRAVFGHFGPVVDSGSIAGVVPSISVSGRVALRSHVALVPEISVGRNITAQRTTYAARVAFVAF